MFFTGSHDLFAYSNRTKLYHGLISNIWDVFIKLIAIFLQGQGRAGISPVLTGGLTDPKGQKRVREDDNYKANWPCIFFVSERAAYLFHNKGEPGEDEHAHDHNYKH